MVYTYAMTTARFQHNLAQLLRRAPWLVSSARVFWRMTQARFTAGVVGVVFNEADELLVVEHVFHPHTPWGLPGGWVGQAEDPAETVQREIMEELALDISVGPVLLAQCKNEAHIDLAYLCHKRGTVGPLSRELLSYQWAALTDLPRLHTFHYNAVQQALAIRTHL